MILPITLTVLACTLATLQLAVANQCGIVVVQEDQMKQDIRREVDTALVSLIRAMGNQTQADSSDNQSQVELREEIKKDVNAALKQTVMNVTGVCEFGAEFDELKLRSDRLEENMRDLSLGLREVDATVESAIETAVEAAVERVVKSAVEAAVEKATKPIKRLLESLVNNVTLLKKLHAPGTSAHPASSCVEILAANPNSPSGYYWLRRGSGSSIRVYCDMTQTCGGITGGWMQVANIDMINSSHTCPQGLKTHTHHSKRVCGININTPGCSSTTFEVNDITYSHVCGKIIGYQDRSPDGFDIVDSASGTIDGVYVDGVSLTHGRNPHRHIWTFAAARSEGDTGPDCPCLNRGPVTVPSFVGNDYFCDTGSRHNSNLNRFHLADPLWDGSGCGSTSTCCSFNNPPWFSKQLPSPTTDDIEMRLCTDFRDDEDITIESVELYVQ